MEENNCKKECAPKRSKGEFNTMKYTMKYEKMIKDYAQKNGLTEEEVAKDFKIVFDFIGDLIHEKKLTELPKIGKVNYRTKTVKGDASGTKTKEIIEIELDPKRLAEFS